MQLTINVRDTTNYPLPNLLLGNTGTSIIIGSTTTNDINTITSTVSNNGLINIVITKSGYNTYNNIIQVFDYDLVIDIFLVSIITDPTNPNYNNSYTYFIAYRKPCSYNVYCIDGSSLTTLNNTYTINSIQYSLNSRNTILNQQCPSTIAIGFTKNSITYSLDFTIIEYKPSINIDIEVTGNACVGGDCDCIPINSTIVVTPTYILNSDGDCPGIISPVNLKTNGDFNVSNTGWIYYDTTPFNNSPLGSYNLIWSSISTTRLGIISTDNLITGQKYQITLTLNSFASADTGIIFRVIDNVNTFGNIYFSQYYPTSFSTPQTITFTFTAANSGLAVIISSASGTATKTLNLSNFIVQEVNSGSITYNLTDYSGNLVDTLTYPINTGTLNTDIQYTKTLNSIGDYTLQTLLSNCCATCENDIILHLCDFIKFIEGCHSYTIQNCSNLSSNNVTFTITDLDNNIINSIQNISLTYGSSYLFATTTDGVYKVIISDNTNTIIRTYIIIDICNILSCITNKIQDILCNNCNCGCNDKHNHEKDCIDWCKKDYDMKRINLLYFDLFNRINTEYRLNSYYTTLDQAKINQLSSIQSLINSLNDYCGCSGDNNVNYGVILNNTNSSGCGCS